MKEKLRKKWNFWETFDDTLIWIFFFQCNFRGKKMKLEEAQHI